MIRVGSISHGAIWLITPFAVLGNSPDQAHAESVAPEADTRNRKAQGHAGTAGLASFCEKRVAKLAYCMSSNLGTCTGDVEAGSPPGDEFLARKMVYSFS